MERVFFGDERADSARILLLPEEGSADLTWWNRAGEKRVEKLNGSGICLIAPGVRHLLRAHRCAGVIGIRVGAKLFRRFVEKEGLREVQHDPLFTLFIQDPDPWHGIVFFRRLCRRATQLNRSGVLAVARELTVLLLEFYQIRNLRQPGEKGQFTDKELIRVIRHLEANLRDRVKISALAKLVSVSERQFMRKFKRTVGVTARKFRRRLQVLFAEPLLRDPRLKSVWDVVFEVGFQSPDHMRRVFREFGRPLPSPARAT